MGYFSEVQPQGEVAVHQSSTKGSPSFLRAKALPLQKPATLMDPVTD